MYLSLQTDAQEIMTEVGGTSLLDEGNTPVFPVIYPANEPRRVWDVVFKGEALNVGMLLSMKYANGVGAPRPLGYIRERPCLGSRSFGSHWHRRNASAPRARSQPV